MIYIKKRVLIGIICMSFIICMSACSRENKPESSSISTSQTEGSTEMTDNITETTQNNDNTAVTSSTTKITTKKTEETKKIVIGEETQVIPKEDPFKIIKNGNITILHYISKDEYFEMKKKGQTESVWDTKSRFEKKYPGAKVTIISKNFSDRISALIQMQAAKVAPDLINNGTQTFPSTAVANIVQPLNDIKEYDPSIWSKQIANFFTFNGKQYAFDSPGFGVRPIMLYYNRSMFERNNLETPDSLFEKGKWNWSALENCCKRLTKDTDHNGEYDQIGYGGWASSIHIFAPLNGKDFIKYENSKFVSNLKDPKVMEALGFLGRANRKYEKGGFYTSSGTFVTEFQNGKLAIMAGPTPTNMKDKWGVVPVPAGPSAAPKTVLAGVGGWSIPVGAKNPQGAMAFVNLLNTPENPKQYEKENKEKFIALYEGAYDPERIYEKYFGPNNILKNRNYVFSGGEDFSSDVGKFFYNINNALYEGKSPAVVAAEYTPVLQNELDKTYNNR